MRVRRGATASRRRGIAFLVLATLAACSSSSAGHTSGSVIDNTVAITSDAGATSVAESSTSALPTTAAASTTTTPHVSPPTVPPPPAAAASPAGSPADQATAIEQLIEQGGDGVAAAWLAAYAAAGVPVLDTPATAADGSDRMGPHWWQVWYQIPVTGLGAGIRIDELFQFLADQPGEAALGLGTAVLAELRDATTGADPANAFLAQFVAARVRARTGIDPLAVTTPVADVVLDGETAQLLSWSVARGAVARIVAPPGTFGSGPAGFVNTAHRKVAYPARRDTVDCASLFASSDATYWINWFLNKLSAGSQVGIFELGSLPNLWTAISNLAPGLLSADKAATVNKVSARLNVLTSLLTFLMQLDAIRVGGRDEPEPTQRTNSASHDGELNKSFYQLHVESDTLPDGNVKALCGLSFLLNAAGIQFQFPASGNLPGVEMLLTPMEGFPVYGGDDSWYVTATDQSQLKQVTDPNGYAMLSVLGRKQKHDIPDYNPRWQREYTVGIEAQPGEVNGNNIFNTFFDGLTTTDATGFAAGAIDVAQTIHWDLGEQLSRFEDWVAGYTIDQVVAQAYHITGKACDLTKPFHLALEGSLGAGVKNTGTFTVDESGWKFTGTLTQGGHALQSDAQGPTTYVVGNNDTPPGVRVGQGSWTVTFPILGPTPLGPGGTHIDGFQLQLIETNDCDQNS